MWWPMAMIQASMNPHFDPPIRQTHLLAQLEELLGLHGIQNVQNPCLLRPGRRAETTDMATAWPDAKGHFAMSALIHRCCFSRKCGYSRCLA